MFCINCGQPNTDNSNFCRYCGTSFTASPMNAPTTAPNVSNYQPPPLKNNPPLPPNNNPPAVGYKPYGWASDSLQSKISPESLPQNIPSTATETQPLRQVQTLPPFAEPANRTQSLTQFSSYAPPQAYQTNVLNAGYRCPRCGTNAPPQFVRKISTAGWVVFAMLLAVFFPLFWIGLLIKEDQRVCPVCMLRIG